MATCVNENECSSVKINVPAVTLAKVNMGAALGFESDLAVLRWIERIYYGVTKGRTYGRLEKEDLLAEGLVAVSEALKKFDPERQASFRGYTRLKASGAMLDAIRKEINTRKGIKTNYNYEDSENLISADLDTQCCTPESIYSKNQLRRSLQTALNNLSLKEQEVIICRHIHDLNFREISARQSKATRSCAYKIHKKAIKRLSLPLKHLDYRLFLEDS